MRSLLFVFILCGFSIPDIGHASFIKGNGGNSIVCPTSVHLLDIYESGELENFRFTSPDLESRAEARAQQRLPKADFLRIQNWIAEWNRDVQWLNGISLGAVTDSYHFVVPAKCTVVQTVLAREPLPGEKRYLVRQDLYDRLPIWQQRALQWHEVLYRNLILHRKSTTAGIKDIYNSAQARKMVSALFADDTDGWSDAQWADLFAEFESEIQ